MASPVSGGDGDIFGQLKSANIKDLEEKQRAINERIHATFQKSQQRLAELIDQNSTLPTTVSSVTVLGASNTRHSFLKRIVDPLLTTNRDRPYTQSEVVREVAATAATLQKFGMLEPIMLSVMCSYSQESSMIPYLYTSTRPIKPTLALRLPMLQFFSL